MPRFSILLLVLSAGTLAQTPSGQWRPDGLGVITYPPIGRAARVAGDVKVRFRINATGNTEGVEAVEGPEMLRRATLENVKRWHFSTPTDGQDRIAIFHYQLISSPDGYWDEDAGVPPTKAVFAEDGSVVVTTEGPQERSKSQCPGESETKIPERIETGDFVELYRSGCFGTCPSYKVRVLEDGRVLWDGDAFVKEKGHRETKIPIEEARILIEKFRTPTFWSACKQYSRSVTDSPTYGLQATIGGRNKVISDYADSSPLEVRSLQREIDDAANSHLWRHGSPETESFVNIEYEWLGKPGQSALMRAAMGDRAFDLDALLQTGAGINTRDGSGWTALMYAAAGYDNSSFLMKLLGAGADIKVTGRHGETPLMVSALGGYFDEELVQAGSPINAQTFEGITALMVLAQRANPDEITDALKAGADVTLKDHQGRTALDYLTAANCGRPIVAGETMWEGRGQRCNVLDKDDVAKSKRLLLRAMSRRGRVVSATDSRGAR